MEVTYILQGRPWKFDEQTSHDGHTNQYIFFTYEKGITLLPLSPQEVKKDRNKVKKDKEEKGQVSTKVLLAYKKSFPKQKVHQKFFYSQTKREEQGCKQEGKSGLENLNGLS